MNKFLDIRVIGQEIEIKEFLDICKVIQQLGRNGSSRSFKIGVDGDGTGRLAFYGREIDEDGKESYVEFNSNGIDVDKLDEMDLSIGE